MADAETNEWPSPFDIVFSCSICHATVSEVYRGDVELRDETSTDRDGSITKLWLTDCSHLTCGKHLEGGGVPDHAPGEKPQAACPLCSNEKGDKTKKSLHGIRGSHKGTFHPDIDKSWFDLPPIRLEGRGKGLEALRFQYLSLIRFGVNVAFKYRNSRISLKNAETKVAEGVMSCKALESENERLRTRVQNLERCEKELKPWKEREAKITYYLGIFTDITRENEKLREQLIAMGYAVPSRRYSLNHAPIEDVPSRNNRGESRNQPYTDTNSTELLTRPHDTRLSTAQNDQQEVLDSGSSRTMPGPSEPITNIHAAVPIHPKTQKRKLDERGDFQDETTRRSPYVVRGERRQNMSSLGDDLEHDRTITHLETRIPSGMRAFQPSPHREHRRPGRIDVDNGASAYQHRAWQYDDQQRSNMVTADVAQSPHQTLVSRSQQYVNGPQPYTQSTFFEELQRLSTHGRHENHVLNSHQPDHIVAQGPQIGQQQYDHRDGVYPHNTGFLQTPRMPLRQANDAPMNIQRPTQTWTNNQRSFSSPIRRYGTSYKTPSPEKRPFIYQPDSVASPFFQRTGAVEHTGRVTIPPRPHFTTPRIPQQLSRQSPLRNEIPISDTYSMPPPPKPTAPRPPAPATPHHRTNNTTQYDPPQPFRTLIPSTPRTTDGLFQRPDQPPTPSPVFPDRSTYPQPSPSRDPLWLSQRFSYEQQQPTTPFPTAGFRPVQHPQTPVPHMFTGNSGRDGVGSRSGVSRPSREWMREGLVMGSGRRSVRR